MMTRDGLTDAALFPRVLYGVLILVLHSCCRHVNSEKYCSPPSSDGTCDTGPECSDRLPMYTPIEAVVPTFGKGTIEPSAHSGGLQREDVLL